MLRELDVRQWPPSANRQRDADTPWPQIHAQALECARAVFDAVRARPELKPDLVVGHGGLVPTLLLREMLDCPFVDFCEYYFATSGRDLTFRVDLPAVEPSAFFPRCINAATLLSLTACDAGYTPTHFQRDCFPERFRGKIEVQTEGIDTELYRPKEKPSLAAAGVPDGARVVTYVARGLESVRGFDLFMRLAERIGAARADVRFVVVGGTDIHYGWDTLFTGGQSFKDWVMDRFAGDRARVHFLGMVDPGVLADVLARSDLHVYLSVPFVASWSLLNALSAGCVVLAGDVESVREFIEPGRNGLLAPLFDVEEQTRLALDVLDEPAKYKAMRKAARRLVVEKYSIEVAVPGLKEFFERVAG
jgi:glycosyltransferase involved in cell wall biosynthesis